MKIGIPLFGRSKEAPISASRPEQPVEKEVFTREEVINTFNSVYGRLTERTSNLRPTYELYGVVSGFTPEKVQQNKHLLIDYYISQNAVWQITGRKNGGFTGAETDFSFPVEVSGFEGHREFPPIDGLRRFIAYEKQANKGLAGEVPIRQSLEKYLADRDREDLILDKSSRPSGLDSRYSYTEDFIKARRRLEAFIISKDPLRRSAYQDPVWAQDNNYILATRWIPKQVLVVPAA